MMGAAFRIWLIIRWSLGWTICAIEEGHFRQCEEWVAAIDKEAL